MTRKYKIEDDEMSMIMWSLEETYKLLKQDKSKESHKDYRRTKKLHHKLMNEYIRL